MPLPLEHLWRQVLGCATERLGLPVPGYAHLRQAKVRQLDVPGTVDEDILRLQVPIQNIHRVKVLERQENVRSVKLGSVLLKATDLAQVEEQFATRTVLKAEV